MKSVLTSDSGRSKTTRGSPRKREYATHLGRTVSASVKASGICVDIRQNWLPPNQTEVVPTEKGITLRLRIRQIKRCGQCDMWLCTRTEFGCTVSVQIGSHESVGFLILPRMQPRSLCGMVNRLWRLLWCRTSEWHCVYCYFVKHVYVDTFHFLVY